VSRRPNFLLVMADQLAAPALPMYGHAIVKAPNLQRLAADGVTFLNAYCNNPICASSRFSMMSGQLSSRIGAYDNAAEFCASTPTFAHYLRALGYRTCLSGKMHFIGPDQLHGFEERLTTDIYPSDFAWTPDWLTPGDPYAPSSQSMRGVVEAGPCERSLQLDYDDEAAFEAVRWLYDYARTGNERPFLLTVSFTHPHNPYTITPQYWQRYDQDAIDLPQVPDIPFEQRDPWSQRQYRLIRQDEYALTSDAVRTARHAYYGMIGYVDDQVGRLLDTLESARLRDNTVVIFVSDHGDMMGERGMWYKFNPFEWSLRVPFIVRAPGVDGGQRRDKVVSLVDLLPTFLDLATDGNPPPVVNEIDGHSVAELLHGDGGDWPDTAAAEYTAEGTCAPCLILRAGNYKYVYCETDPAMLFDLRQDPHELKNLCGNPEYCEIEERMRAEIFKRWSPEELRTKVIASQQRRLFVQKSLLSGRRHAWDFQPSKDASRQYVRSGGDASPTGAKERARFPHVSPRPPDFPRIKNKA
jgi:choline-sulfatase